jgi:hypothetical protein
MKPANHGTKTRPLFKPDKKQENFRAQAWRKSVRIPRVCLRCQTLIPRNTRHGPEQHTIERMVLGRAQISMVAVPAPIIPEVPAVNCVGKPVHALFE